jgi:hypothetical protein
VPPLGDEVGMMGGRQRSAVEGGSLLGDGRLDGADGRWRGKESVDVWSGGRSPRRRWRRCTLPGDMRGEGREPAMNMNTMKNDDNHKHEQIDDYIQ